MCINEQMQRGDCKNETMMINSNERVDVDTRVSDIILLCKRMSIQSQYFIICKVCAFKGGS